MERLIELHKQMKVLCLEARISEYRIDKLLDHPEKIELIEEFHRTVFTNAVKVKALLPQEIWDRYKMYGLKNTREQNMLSAAFKEMRKFFMRIIPDDQTAKVQGNS